jgi:hypothetical protein
MIITAVPHNRRLPEIEFSSAREFERALGNNDPQDYREFTCERATPEEAMFCRAVPFDWQRPDEWFEAAQHYTDPDREIDGVPAPVYLIACDNAGRRFDDLADFEKFVGYATAFTLEEALDSVASQRANDDYTTDYYNIPEMIEYLKENDWCEVEIPNPVRVKTHYVRSVVCHKDALPMLRRAIKKGEDAVHERLTNSGQTIYGGGIRYDDEDTYYFCDLEDFVKACATCGRNSTPFEGHENEWFDEDRYFDAMMDDYDRIEYEDETYFFYHG